MSGEFIGRGWAFPIRTDATGSIALVSHERELEESIRLILGTAYGERPMRPQFGCGIHDYVFAPANATTAGRIGYEVRAALERWEPRVDIVDVIVTTAEDQPGTLYIDISYVQRETNDRRNLVFPFYTIPTEGES
ncbi:MAG: GPW/gp25 family protein [Actinomycetota bacterium]|nr:GPW/gp25 family protein [Actinomycetota bacterium]